MNSAQVDFQQLRIKHILYKSKFRAVLFGGNFDPVFFSSSGPIHVWFHTIGLPTYGTDLTLNRLIALQDEMNATVVYYTDLYSAGKIDEAYNGLAIIDAKSEVFLSLLLELEKKLSAPQEESIF